MTIFIFACGGLILFSGLFYLFPRRRPGGTDQDLARANLEWFRLRQAELDEEGVDTLKEDAQLRLLEDEQQGKTTVASARRSRPFPLWLLLPFMALASTAIYYQLGAASDVVISHQLEALDQNSSPQQMQELMEAVELRSSQRPDNLHYVTLLGRYYMGQQDYAKAARTYGELAIEAPEDAQVLAYAAQAEYLAGGRSLSDGARMKAEQALAINPHQRTALGLLGMASFEQKKYRAAIEYWQRLLAMETPGSDSAKMISGVIESARQNLGESPTESATGSVAASSAAAPAPAQGNAGPGVTVHVALPEQGGVKPSDTVFILARNAASDSRMPIAVQRLQASQLPITLRLDDSNSMAGQKLSETESVIVVVQVSPQGRPGEANATWLGQAGPLAPSLDSDPLDIILTPKT